jgi:hypothetical protein
MGSGDAMSDQLPLVDLLADCQSHRERAEWLLQCPQAIIKDESLAIRAICQKASFLAGVSYVEAERSALSATRLPNGEHKAGIRIMLTNAREGLRLAAGLSMEVGR